MKRPTGPALGDLKAWTSVVFVLVTSRALWISSFSVDQDAAAAAFRGRRDLDGIQEVERSVGALRRGGPHGADENHGLVRGDGQVEEERGLLDRVGAVGHHDAVHGLVLDELVDPPEAA